jgi:c-di-GMP-binding flagellar brake protein YcgR
VLWSVDGPAQRELHADANHPQLQRLVDADEAVAVAYLDSVKLQFDLQDLLLVRGLQRSALQARCPHVVYRFQRRSAYRVRTLERHSPSARLRHPAMPDMQLALRVLDVSIGGCALFCCRPTCRPRTRPDAGGVQIELDADTRFTATLQIQHMSSIPAQRPSGCGGCEWAHAGARVAERALQRYIDQTQKRRAAALAG